MACIKLFVCCHQQTLTPAYPLLVPIQVGVALADAHFPGFLYDDKKVKKGLIKSKAQVSKQICCPLRQKLQELFWYIPKDRLEKWKRILIRNIIFLWPFTRGQIRLFWMR